ncbi:MAG: hypothetical protein WBL35_10060, partial [Ornithinibacter sp.]
MRSIVTTIGAAAATVLAAAGVAAAAPSSDGTLHACYDEQSGQLRLVDPDTGTPKGCGKKEGAVTWNEQGPQGDPGPAGPAGPSGATGPAGE